MIQIAVGGMGHGGGGGAGGGGGGSFVYDSTSLTKLIIAGGGSGSAYNNTPGANGVTSSNGGPNGGAGGSSVGGGGGGEGFGGGGTASGGSHPAGGGGGFPGLAGGNPSSVNVSTGTGGFGGGGGGGYNYGGGGFGGGNGGDGASHSGSGGSSYNGGTNQVLVAGARSGNGYVSITELAPPTSTPEPASALLLGAGARGHRYGPPVVWAEAWLSQTARGTDGAAGPMHGPPLRHVPRLPHAAGPNQRTGSDPHRTRLPSGARRRNSRDLVVRGNQGPISEACQRQISGIPVIFSPRWSMGIAIWQ